MKNKFWLPLFLFSISISSYGQNKESNLPDALTFNSGKKVTSAKQWNARREELLQTFRKEMYGTSPGRPKDMRFEVFDNDKNALGGKATRKQITVHIRENGREAKFDILLYIPNKAKHPVPAIIGINFIGNHAINADPGIKLSKAWVESSKNSPCVVDGKATDACRGLNASQWPVDSILDAGFALATIYREEIASDRNEESFKTGVHVLYPELQNREDNFGTVAAWAWALSRGMDYLETDKEINSKKVTVFGFSRLGKAALWAGANDTRFAEVISNESGAGGAKLFYRGKGENIRRLNTVFPHWYAKSFRKYIDKDTLLPFDQHLIIDLIAPRPVYVASAEGDKNSDPEGEFASVKEADKVYRFLKTNGLPVKEIPALNTPVMGQVGYHIRTGGHDVTSFDWHQFLIFSNLRLQK